MPTHTQPAQKTEYDFTARFSPPCKWPGRIFTSGTIDDDGKPHRFSGAGFIELEEIEYSRIGDDQTLYVRVFPPIE